MADWGSTIITNAGKVLMARAHTGTPLTFTRAAFGDGEHLDGTVLEQMTFLESEKLSMLLSGIEVVEDQARIRMTVDNSQLAEGFYARELGVFAQDPDDEEGEILYAVAFAGQRGDYIPGPPQIVEQELNIYVVVGQGSVVSAVISDTIVLATKSDVTDHDSFEGSHKRIQARLYSQYGERAGSVFVEEFTTNQTLIKHLALTVISTTAGSDLVTVSQTGDLSVGADYMITYNDVVEPVRIAAIVSPMQVRMEAVLANSFANATLVEHTLDIDTAGVGLATPAVGSLYLAGPFALSDESSLLIELASGGAAPTVEIREVGASTWAQATLVRQVTTRPGWDCAFYSFTTTVAFYVRVTWADTSTCEWIALLEPDVDWLLRNGLDGLGADGDVQLTRGMDGKISQVDSINYGNPRVATLARDAETGKLATVVTMFMGVQRTHTLIRDAETGKITGVQIADQEV